MKKFVCKVCGYVYEADELADDFKCPVCKAGKDKFECVEELEYQTEHVIGVAKGAKEDIINDLRANFDGECHEVGMYLAMSRAAFREGYAEIGMYYEKAAFEEAEHAAKFAELLGEVVSPSSKENLKVRIDAEIGATNGKLDLAKRARKAGFDDVADTVNEMAKDEARHGKAFQGLYDRYFNNK